MLLSFQVKIGEKILKIVCIRAHIYLKDRMIEETEIFHLLVQPPDGHTNQGRARQSQSSSWVSPVGNGAIFCCFPWRISRELDQGKSRGTELDQLFHNGPQMRRVLGVPWAVLNV